MNTILYPGSSSLISLHCTLHCSHPRCIQTSLAHTAQRMPSSLPSRPQKWGPLRGTLRIIGHTSGFQYHSSHGAMTPYTPYSTWCAKCCKQHSCLWLISTLHVWMRCTTSLLPPFRNGVTPARATTQSSQSPNWSKTLYWTRVKWRSLWLLSLSPTRGKVILCGHCGLPSIGCAASCTLLIAGTKGIYCSKRTPAREVPSFAIASTLSHCLCPLCA